MTTRPELCILFVHHRDDDVTRLHFELVKRSNPNAVIVPLCDEPESALPGAIDVSRFPSEWDTSDKWSGVDTMLYRWFMNRTCEADRYLVLEYDCRCDVDLRRYFAEYWDADVVASYHVTRASQPEWVWFKELHLLSPEERPFAAGLVPFACTMFAHDALERIVAIVSRERVFSELRMGTAAQRLGLRIKTLEGDKHLRVSSAEYPFPIVWPGLYHAVKSVDHNRTRLLHGVKQVMRRFTSQATRRALLDLLERSPLLKRLLRRAPQSVADRYRV